jgi:hypothetical protein
MNSIESTNNRISDKTTTLIDVIDILQQILITFSGLLVAQVGKKYVDWSISINNIPLNLYKDTIENISNSYSLACASILLEYYSNKSHESKCTAEYYRIITSENFGSKLQNMTEKIQSHIPLLYKIAQGGITTRERAREELTRLDDVAKSLERISHINLGMYLERQAHDICTCGTRMTVMPEQSEMRCESCGESDKIIGAVFRDDQFYPQEGQKTKHGGYDTTRHYRFWIERIQAIESFAFEQKDLDSINYVIKRDRYTSHEINCKIMRQILKDPHVNATYLNEHIPLLVKLFGGKPPPKLDFHEDRLISMRFNHAMQLYDRVNPDGGNKPYYPYFIYKILEHLFANNEKIRVLEYIHLQARDTMIKNDLYFKQMCELADPEVGLKYIATDPTKYT